MKPTYAAVGQPGLCAANPGCIHIPISQRSFVINVFDSYQTNTEGLSYYLVLLSPIALYLCFPIFVTLQLILASWKAFTKPLLLWKSGITYPACKAHAPYICYLWPVCLYHIFPRYLHDMNFGGRGLLNIKHVCWFSLRLSSETFLILRRIKRDIITNVHGSSCKVPLILVRF
jgi:hypothetical protein